MKEKFTNSENKFKADLADYASWDGDDGGMWVSIEDSLEEKKKRKIMIWWILTGAMCLGVFGVGYWNIDKGEPTSQLEVEQQNIDTEERSISYDGVTTAQEGKTIEEGSDTNTSNSHTSITDIKYFDASASEVKVNDNKEEQQSESFSTTVSTEQPIQVQKNEYSKVNNSTRNSGSVILQEDNVDSAAIKKSIQYNYAIEAEEQEAKLSQEAAMEVDKLDASNSSFENAIAFTMLDRLESTVASLDSLEDPCFVINYIEKEESPTKESKFSLGYYRGFNYHTNGYHFGQAANTLRKETERAMVGSEEGVNFEYKLGGGFVMGSGVGVSKYWEQFDYVDEVDVELLETWVLIRYHINTNTEDTTLVRGRRTLNGVTSREIRHHNSWTMLRVPLLIGKEWSTKRTGFKVLAGVSLERGIAQETKDSSDDYNLFIQSEATPTNRKIGVNLELVPSIEFKITPRFAATATIPLRYAMTSWDYRDQSNDSFAQKRPLIAALNVGLKYGF